MGWPGGALRTRGGRRAHRRRLALDPRTPGRPASCEVGPGVPAGHLRAIQMARSASGPYQREDDHVDHTTSVQRDTSGRRPRARHAPQPQGVAIGTLAMAGPGSPIVLFSKHLAELGWRDLGVAVRQAGFDGVDLTVRPAGHVLPARVTEDLPRAVAAIRDGGSQVAMLTTGLTKPDDPAARATLQAARAVGVPRLKAGYYRYAFATSAANSPRRRRRSMPW